MRYLDGGDLRSFGLRIGDEELLRQEMTIRFQIAAAEVQCLALDEILHRIGCYQPGVITGCVSRPKCVAVDQHFDVCGKDGTNSLWLIPAAMKPVDSYITLAVIIPFRAA